MPQYIASKPRRANDENWVLTVISITLIAVLCMFAFGYFLNNHWTQEQQTMRQQQEYENYRHATNVPPAAPSTSANSTNPSSQRSAIEQNQQLRARLLAHPNVTPGPGFDRPGVQSTGAAIVDAIEGRQERRAQ